MHIQAVHSLVTGGECHHSTSQTSGPSQKEREDPFSQVCRILSLFVGSLVCYSLGHQLWYAKLVSSLALATGTQHASSKYPSVVFIAIQHLHCVKLQFLVHMYISQIHPIMRSVFVWQDCVCVCVCVCVHARACACACACVRACVKMIYLQGCRQPLMVNRTTLTFE